MTSPVTYGPDNPLAKQADGVFDMPMGFHQMTRFEALNNVCVNVGKLKIFLFEKL